MENVGCKVNTQIQGSFSKLESFHDSHPNPEIIQVLFYGIFVSKAVKQLVSELWTNTPLVGTFLEIDVCFHTRIDIPSSIEVRRFCIVSQIG